MKDTEAYAELVGAIRDYSRIFPPPHSLAPNLALASRFAAEAYRLESIVIEAQLKAEDLVRDYRISGQHDTWDSWHEGRSDGAAEIVTILEGADAELPE